MNIKKYRKIILIIIFLIILLFVNIFGEKVVASSDLIGNMLNSASNYTNGEANQIPKEKTKEIVDILFNILLVIGIVIIAITGIILGLQFIIGSVEEKSKIKESLVPYIIGCVVVFGAFGIWKLAVIILKQVV